MFFLEFNILIFLNKDIDRQQIFVCMGDAINTY